MGHFIGQDIHPCNLLQQYKYIIRVTTDSSWCYESSHDQRPPVHSASLFTSAQMILLILICQLQHLGAGLVYCHCLTSLCDRNDCKKPCSSNPPTPPRQTVSTQNISLISHITISQICNTTSYIVTTQVQCIHNLCWTDNNGLFHSLISA